MVEMTRTGPRVAWHIAKHMAVHSFNDGQERIGQYWDMLRETREYWSGIGVQRIRDCHVSGYIMDQHVIRLVGYDEIAHDAPSVIYNGYFCFRSFSEAKEDFVKGIVVMEERKPYDVVLTFDEDGYVVGWKFEADSDD